LFPEKLGRDANVSPGEFAGVEVFNCGGEFFDPITTHGEPVNGWE